MRLLKKGLKGKDVGNWQRFLTRKGYLLGKIDEDFGSRTERASTKFQEDNKLFPDGLVGKRTIQAAMKLGFENVASFEREVNEIIVHITASDDNATVEDIRKMHVNDNGWKDIGYHWLVDRDGIVHPGRDEDTIGAHCKNHNEGTVAISYIARGDDHKANAEYGEFMTAEQKAAFEKKIAELLTKYGLTTDNVVGHNKYDAGKACPCFDSDNKEFKDGIQKELNTVTTNV